ncbi:hypothetical protein GCM10011320_06330 [Neoroseomonas lacus]|uniref:Uncharacterized protein n=1 Tax=Neoroseomonas lacus TaxID=287609 RepID=A0A917K818_9PROT|nr:hypothetical protein GCM10011320_06330 [Neoroseomonas lacus]
MVERTGVVARVWHTVPGAGPVELHAIVTALADAYGVAEAEETTRVQANAKRARVALPIRNRPPIIRTAKCQQRAATARS